MAGYNDTPQYEKGDYFQTSVFTFTDGREEPNRRVWPIKNVDVSLYAKNENRKSTCISVIMYSDGSMGIDPSDTVGFPGDSWLMFDDQHSPQPQKLRGYTGVPQAVLMEFFLLLFEKEVIPGAEYHRGTKYPRPTVEESKESNS